MKFECPTYLKSKGKAMAVTLSDGEVSDDESESECPTFWVSNLP